MLRKQLALVKIPKLLYPPTSDDSYEEKIKDER